MYSIYDLGLIGRFTNPSLIPPPPLFSTGWELDTTKSGREKNSRVADLLTIFFLELLNNIFLFLKLSNEISGLHPDYGQSLDHYCYKPHCNTIKYAECANLQGWQQDGLLMDLEREEEKSQ